MIKRIIRFLLLADFIWSVPLAFLSFIGFGIFGEWFFGEGFAFYDPSFFHAVIYTALTLITFNAVALTGLWFNFRTVYKYYIGDSKTDYKNLEPKFKIGLFFILYFTFMFICLFIWGKLV